MFHLQFARQRQHGGRAHGRAQQPPHVGLGNGAGRFNHQQHNAAPRQQQQQQHHHDLIGHGGVGDAGFLNNNLLPPFAVHNNHQQHVVAAPDLNVGQGGNHPAAPPAGGDGFLNNQHHPVQADQPRLAQNANLAAVHQHHGDWLHENNPQPRQAQAAPPLQDLQGDLAQNANIAAGNQQNGDGLVIPVSVLPLRNLRDPGAQGFFELLGENMALPLETFQTVEEAEQGVPITSAVAGKRVLVTVLRRLRALMRSHVRSNPLVRGSITDLGINLPATMNPIDFLQDNNAISTIAEQLLGELSSRDAFTRFVQAWAVSVILPFSERNGDNTLQTAMRNSFLTAVAEECGLEAGSVRFDLEDNHRAENVINQFIRKHVITSVIRNLPGRKDSIADRHRYWLPMVPRFFGDVGFNFSAFRITDSLPRELPETSYVDVHVPFLQFLGFNALVPFHVHIISDAGSNLWNVLSLPPPARPPAQARQAPAAPMAPPARPPAQEAPMRIVLANIAGGDGDNTTLTSTNSWQAEGAQAEGAQALNDDTSLMLSQRGQVSMSRSNDFTSTSSSSESSVSKMSVDDDTALEEVGEISNDEAPPPKDDQELPNADNLSLSDAEDGLGLVAGKQDENVNAFSSDKEIVRTNETEALQQGDTDPPCSDDDEEEEPGENRAKKRNSCGRGDGGSVSKVRKVEVESVVSLSAVCSPAHQLVSFLTWSLTPLSNLF